ncbi:MAG: RHS repeat-associated core domain-containing protein [Chthoniobacterales bacterium]
MQSHFGYASGSDSIDSLTTPYGTTQFSSGMNGTNRWIEITDPLGSKERVEYRDYAPGIAASDPAVPNVSGISNSGLDAANTFYWDKKAMAEAPGDYTKAQITHWLYNADGSISGIPSSEKRVFENRVWYTYVGQPNPTHVGSSANPLQIARVLDDGSTQLSQFEYNAVGKTTKATDPMGRVVSSIYDANNIDLLEIRQTTGSSNELLRSFSYNSQHEPLSDTDAAGQPTIFTYNAYGQILTRQNARNETTTLAYGGTVPEGYLASITSPQFNGSAAVTTFAYDSLNRVRTVTDADSYAVTTDYDNLDRPTQITYPDGTSQQFQYAQDFGNGPLTILDLSASKDRVGRWTYRHYTANRQMDSMTDPLGQTTSYAWCTCGALIGITDPNGNVTTFNRDLQSRLTSKVFADNSSITYTYENTTSRLKSMTDALGQTTNYQYFADNNIQQISYANALHLTPNASYTYDPYYNRITSMADGIGTTTYSYYPVSSGTLGAGQLYQVDGPFSDDTITYTYDQLGRMIGQDIDGTTASMGYDTLGRLGTTSNALGSFARAYDGVTPRVLALDYPNGQKAEYSYFGNSNDRRLQTLQHLTSGSVNLSRHDYSYDPEGQIQTWNKTLGGIETDLSFVYDDARQLQSVTQANTKFNYAYDAAGNRLAATFSATHSHGGNAFTANNLNQLDSVTRSSGIGASYGPSPLTYLGNGNMTYDGNNETFEWDAANRLSAVNYLGSGSRTEFAYDGLGRRVKITEYNGVAAATVQPESGDYATFATAPFALATGGYTITLQGLNRNGGDNTVLVDAVGLDGALVPDGSFETPDASGEPGGYVVDPSDTSWSYQGSAGVAVNGSDLTSSNPDAPDGNQVAFIKKDGTLWQTWSAPAGTYSLSFQAAQRGSGNDSSQQLRVSLWASGSPASTKTFVWSGNTIAEERDSTGANVTKRFFVEGEQRIGGSDAGNYYYSRDHLGSIREVTDSSGALKAQYDYDAWGNSVVVNGSMNVDFGFTGHYSHQPSGLNLSLYRAYNATLGRWLSRDPIGENGGLNLYDYVFNNPINLWDPLGLDALLVLQRDGGNGSSGILNVFENGRYQGSTPANVNLFTPNRQGPGPGDYLVLPKREDGIFPAGTPAVSDPNYLDQPGRAGPGYDEGMILIHPRGPLGKGPDSRGCVTLEPVWADYIKKLMDRNLNNGGTTLKIFDRVAGRPYGIPVGP